jgi:uncharacterized protein YjbI with pentapeptide repeats
MNANETLALYQQGKAAWNAWAEQKLAERAALEKKGVWIVQHEISEDLIGLNDETRNWLNESQASFRDHIFDDANFMGFIFPGNALFSGAEFKGTSLFKGGIFKGYTSFYRTYFRGIVTFSSAIFSSGVQFVGTTFDGPTFFGETVFNKDTLFSAAKVNGYFIIKYAVFDAVPNFVQAQFLAPPMLTECDFCANTEQAKLWRRRRGFAHTAAERWRAMKLLAAHSLDHERELFF